MIKAGREEMIEEGRKGGRDFCWETVLGLVERKEWDVLGGMGE